MHLDNVKIPFYQQIHLLLTLSRRTTYISITLWGL